MGCDIHLYVEIEQEYSGGKYWKKVGNIFKNKYYNKDLFPDDWNNKFIDEPGIGRNYDLFSLFANVRNGTWGEEIKSISNPRGLPVDISDEIKEKSDAYGEDGHSHSYLFLDELKNFDWKESTIKHSAYVSEKQEKDYKEKGIIPKCYSAMSTIGVVLNWEESYYDSFGKYFVDKIIPEFEKLEKWGKVRLVFWFDN